MIKIIRINIKMGRGVFATGSHYSTSNLSYLNNNSSWSSHYERI